MYLADNQISLNVNQKLLNRNIFYVFLHLFDPKYIKSGNIVKVLRVVGHVYY